MERMARIHLARQSTYLAAYMRVYRRAFLYVTQGFTHTPSAARQSSCNFFFSWSFVLSLFPVGGPTAPVNDASAAGRCLSFADGLSLRRSF